jgi:hypothetical protein
MCLMLDINDIAIYLNFEYVFFPFCCTGCCSGSQDNMEGPDNLDTIVCVLVGETKESK